MEPNVDTRPGRALGLFAIAAIVGAATLTAFYVKKRHSESNNNDWKSLCDQAADKLASKLKVYDIAS